MPDIVDELRVKCSWCRPCQSCKEVMEAAAKEIERLREEVSELHLSGLGSMLDDYRTTLAVVGKRVVGGGTLAMRVQTALLNREAEIDRLRAVMAEVASMPGCLWLDGQLMLADTLNPPKREVKSNG